VASLANEAGISESTTRSWLSALESSDLVYLLRPYHRNFGKRLVKSPKLYFVDTGLAAWLLGVWQSKLNPNYRPIGKRYSVEVL
jgi:predicted AAA+ superfamily ATPase